MDRRSSSPGPISNSHRPIDHHEAGDEESVSDGHALSAHPGPSSEALQRRIVQVQEACKNNDIAALAALATSGDGFANEERRRLAWPLLLGCDKSFSDETTGDWKTLKPHRDEDQVKLDVNRSFIYYPVNPSGQELSERKEELLDLITEVLRTHPSLYYFQGYHDIVSVFLLILGRERATQAVVRLSLLRIRDFMLPGMSPAVMHLSLLPDILHAADRDLARRIARTQPFFALAATLTLYAHEIQEYADIARLFDFFLASEAVMPIYLYAANILDRREELLDIPDDEPEMLHFRLSKLSQPLDIGRLIDSSLHLFASHPPNGLSSWRRVSSDSVLKTTRSPNAVASQPLAYGQETFERQAVSLRRWQALDHTIKLARYRLWKYRRPAMLGAAAVAVGVLSWWLGKRGQFRHRSW